MKRVEMETDQMPGQDSFLDVITNIVGILILLVLVVGLKSSRSVHNGSETLVAEQARAEDQLRQISNSADNAATGVRDLVNRVGNARTEAAFRESERAAITTLVTAAEQELAERRAKLSTNDQRDFDLRQKLNAAQMELDELTRKQIALMAEDAAPEQLECQPTTIAKTVAGKEVHLLLANDHVAIVPYDELIDQMKADARENEWRLKGQDKLIRTIGPTNGFRLKYVYVKEDVMRASDAGTYMLGQIYRGDELRSFLPVTTPVGEPAAESLKPNSELFQHLNGMRADGTTVTIWTYPGNYDRLRRLKQAIRAVGFQVAVRPLPNGRPIGAASDGTKTLSE